MNYKKKKLTNVVLLTKYLYICRMKTAFKPTKTALQARLSRQNFVLDYARFLDEKVSNCTEMVLH